MFAAASLVACESKPELAVVFGGDVMLDRGVRAQINVKGVGHFTEEISSVFGTADFGVVNLECPATAINAPLAKEFIFRAEPQWLTDLHDANITHLIVANNHSYDQGRSGLISTVENIQKAALVSVGYGADQRRACEPVLLEKDDLRMAIFSSVLLPLENWMYLPDKPGMCQATVEELIENIKTFKAADTSAFVVVSLHWGVEYQPMPSGIQREQAESLISAGADAIIGHHPHVVQSYESIDGKPVFYSVGNLIFDSLNPGASEGILVKIVVGEKSKGVEIIPYSMENGKPVLMSDDEERTFRLKLQKFSDPLP